MLFCSKYLQKSIESPGIAKPLLSQRRINASNRHHSKKNWPGWSLSVAIIPRLYVSMTCGLNILGTRSHSPLPCPRKTKLEYGLPKSSPIGDTRFQNSSRVVQSNISTTSVHRNFWAVEPRHHQHVPGFELAEQPAKLHAVAFGSARYLAKHLLASGLGQLAHLSVNALAVRRYPRIPVFHGSNYAPRICT
jgi:hypothetical protein